jgi:DNA-binding GntR family transcriptional regulator
MSAKRAVNMPKRRSRSLLARHHVRDHLQQMILSGQCKPGSKLVQQGLARRFGVSQAVVREALLELQFCGLVEAVDNRGIYVGRLDAQKLIESYEVREVHEGLAARLCVERVTRVEIRGLEGLAERICRLGNASKFQDMALLDREFHQQLLRLSGNSMLIRLADNYWVFGKVVRLGRAPRAVHKEHMAILQAIAGNRPQIAEKLMREHIRSGRELLEQQVKSGAFVPIWVS